MSEHCKHCNTELKAWGYESPLWAGSILLPACLVVSCECGETFDYVPTAYRGEKLYSFPDADVTPAEIARQLALVNAVPASVHEADWVEG